MKQPRVDEFDPNASKKPLKSSMDHFPTIEKQSAFPVVNDTSTGSTTVPVVRVVRDTYKRKIKTRHPFDIYEDQVEALRQFSLEERHRGGIGSQSAMVREALDDYIAKRRIQ